MKEARFWHGLGGEQDQSAVRDGSSRGTGGVAVCNARFRDPEDQTGSRRHRRQYGEMFWFLARFCRFHPASLYLSAAAQCLGVWRRFESCAARF